MARASRPRASLPALSALLAALVALLVLAPAGTAAAHDSLAGTEPADGQTLETAPEELVLSFTGEVAQVGALVEVTGPDGEQVTDGDPQARGTEVTQGLAPDLGPGTYEVTWRITSQDGHPVAGTFGFEVAQGAGEEAAADDSTSPGAEETAEAATTPAPAGPQDTAAQDTAAGDDASITAGPDAAAEPGGLPAWGWAVVVLAALGLLGLLGWTWTRGRG